MYRSQVLICGGTGCTSSGSMDIKKALEDELKKRGIDKEVEVIRTGDFVHLDQ